MTKKSLLAAIGTLSIITLTGAGCSMYKPGSDLDRSYSKESNDNAPAKETEKDAYKKAADVKLSDSAGNQMNDALKGLVEEVFGDVKTSSYMQTPGSQGSIIAQYTAKSAVSADDVGKLVKALTSQGFKIDQSGVADNNGFILATGKKNTVTLTFEIGGQTINAAMGLNADFANINE